MNWLELFGPGQNPNALQMCVRAVIVFPISLILLRISGRRSFGIKGPVDNIITILLGALLSRAITGASPFWAVIAASLVVVTSHRLLGLLIARNPALSNIIEGRKIMLYKDGKFIVRNMHRALASEETVMQAIRESTRAEKIDDVAVIYMERNGKITLILK